MARPWTWADAGYRPRYNFAYSGLEGYDDLYDITDINFQPYQSGDDWISLTGQDLVTERYGAAPIVDERHPLWNDPEFQRDLAMWQRAATGEPGTGWAIGDNAGDGWSLGSLFSNEFFLAALATGIAGGAAALTGTPAAAGSGILGASLPADAAALGAEGGLALGAGGAGTAGGIGASAVPAVATPAAAGSGLFGTGITAGQALTGAQLLAGGIGLATSGGGGSGSGEGGDGSPSQVALEANKAIGRRLLMESIAPRLAQFGEGVTQLTALSNASPVALPQQLAPQIEQARGALKQMFQQSSQRFGQYGGGQTQREQAKGMQDIGGKVTRGAMQLPEQARQALAALIENFQSVPQPATPVTQVGTSPFNPASIYASLQSGAALGNTANRVDSYLNRTSSSPYGSGGGYSAGITSNLSSPYYTYALA